MAQAAIQCVQAELNVPGVRALTSTRLGGVSLEPYNALNLGDHVGDDYETVQKNRELLRQQLGLKQAPLWLKQVHGTAVIAQHESISNIEADAIWSNKKGQACAVLTADCLPVLMASQNGKYVAAAHAGWRGLVNGILEAAITAMPVVAQDLVVWLGPAIGPAVYEVGDEVRNAFISNQPENEEAFVRTDNGWLADLYLLARLRLKRLGVIQITGGQHCAFSEPELFYSYRRDGSRSGRMASLIWREE